LKSDKTPLLLLALRQRARPERVTDGENGVVA